MSARALIVAIERYPSMRSGFAADLPGTHAAALAFRRWLVETKRVEPAKILFCADDPNLEHRTAGASASAIDATVGRLVDDGQDRTAELYVFYSGHGFQFVDSPVRRGVNVLVAAEFATLRDSGRECLKLDRIQEQLRAWLGPGEHYYFVDACRNEVRSTEVSPSELGIARDRSALGDAVVNTLYSTRPGAVAAVASGFPDHLMAGLAGRGRAKAWWPEGLFVDFRALARFVGSRLKPPQELPPPVQEGDGKILHLDPPPPSAWTVEVEDAADDDEFTVRLFNTRRQPLDLGDRRTFTGRRHRLEVMPDDYVLELEHSAAGLEALEKPPADLYDECVSRFRKLPPVAGAADAGLPREPPPATFPVPAAAPGSAPPAATLAVASAPGTAVRMRDLQTGALVEAGAGEHRLAPGTYLVRAIAPGGGEVARRQVELTAEDRAAVDLTRSSESARRPLVRILRRRFGSGDGRMDFSERLGRLVGEDVGLWLSLLGAARIVDAPRGFSKLGPMPLATFEDLGSGESAVYALVALKNADGRLRLGISHDARPRWREAARVEGVPGLYHARAPVEPGGLLLSARAGSRAPLTLVSHALPSHVTLVVMTDAEDELRIHQHLLPLHSLVGELPPEIQGGLAPNRLEAVRYATEAQTRFARRRPLAPGGSLDPWSEYWQALLEGSWRDLVSGLLAVYDLVRHGRRESAGPLVETLLASHPEFPDVALLARLLELPGPGPAGPPLVRDGLTTLARAPGSLPLPASHLDYSTPFTLWLGAVETAVRADATTAEPERVALLEA